MSNPARPPGPATSRPGRSPCLIAWDNPGQLRRLAEEFDPTATGHKRLGPATGPTMLIAELTTPKPIERLGAPLGPQVFVAPDPALHIDVPRPPGGPGHP